MNIAGRNLLSEVCVVAEIGNNHEGDVLVAEEMIRRAADAGVDAVKIQTFIPEVLCGADDARLQRLRKFSLSEEETINLVEVARSEDVTFFSTPFDIASARFLNKIQSIFKIASGDNDFFPLIDEVASYGKPLLISTGLASLGLLEIVQDRVLTITSRNHSSLCFLHCVSSYPTPSNEANLGAIFDLRNAFPDVVIGYSDHTEGIKASVLSVAAGARVIEKHFTLDKQWSDFRDHQLAADPTDMRELVELVREASQMLGNNGFVECQPCEEAGKIANRRSIGTIVNLEAGHILSESDLTWIRPGSGYPIGDEPKLIGRRLKHRIRAGTVISEVDVV